MERIEKIVKIEGKQPLVGLFGLNFGLSCYARFTVKLEYFRVRLGRIQGMQEKFLKSKIVLKLFPVTCKKSKSYIKKFKFCPNLTQ